jgi:hypothetical protein
MLFRANYVVNLPAFSKGLNVKTWVECLILAFRGWKLGSPQNATAIGSIRTESLSKPWIILDGCLRYRSEILHCRADRLPRYLNVQAIQIGFTAP